MNVECSFVEKGPSHMSRRITRWFTALSSHFQPHLHLNPVSFFPSRPCVCYRRWASLSCWMDSRRTRSRSPTRTQSTWARLCWARGEMQMFIECQQWKASDNIYHRLDDAEMRWTSYFSYVVVKHRKLNQINAVREFRGYQITAPFQPFDEFVWNNRKFKCCPVKFLHRCYFCSQAAKCKLSTRKTSTKESAQQMSKVRHAKYQTCSYKRSSSLRRKVFRVFLR